MAYITHPYNKDPASQHHVGLGMSCFLADCIGFLYFFPPHLAIAIRMLVLCDCYQVQTACEQ